MADFKIYHLNWKEYDWNDWSTHESEKDYGIYQIYGNHSVYGDNSLLYIGKTKKQTYSKRINGHKDFDASQVSKFTKLHLSYFCKIDDLSEANWDEAIDLVETVFIRAHSPALNSQNVMGFLEKDTPNILIYNWGERGSLLPEVSTLRYSELYHNFNVYDFDKLTLAKQ
jgi:hypothetical protein